MMKTLLVASAVAGTTGCSYTISPPVPSPVRIRAYAVAPNKEL